MGLYIAKLLSSSLLKEDVFTDWAQNRTRTGALWCKAITNLGLGLLAVCYADVFGNSRGGAAVSGPLLDLGQLVDEEDAFALSLPAGLHDPGAGWVLAELLHKEIIIGGEHERHRDKICTKHTANS